MLSHVLPRSRSGRRGHRAFAVVAAVAGAMLLPVLTAGPSSADIVRQQEQWVLDALNVPAAWQITQGSGVVVAVIDSGVDPAVSDLSGSVITGPDLTGVHTSSANASWGVHGTWMASLIAGHGHGSFGEDGVLGVAPQAKIMSIRVITDRSDPGYRAYQDEPPGRGQQELAAAIRYAVDHRATVISMSLGYSAPSLVVRSALQYALSHNVVVVASSGNAGTAQDARGHGHAPYSFPADYPGVIGVAALARSGLPAYFSSDNLSVQVAAPGVNVPTQGRGSRYWAISGTSPACALTAGVVALIRSKYPRLTAPQVRRSLVWSTASRPPGGYDDQVGFGAVDAAAALRFAGRIAAQTGRSRVEFAKAVDAGFFGGGRSSVPPAPVSPRGKQALYLWSALGAAFLLLTVGSLGRITTVVAARRPRRVLANDEPSQMHRADPGQSAPYQRQEYLGQPYSGQQDPGQAGHYDLRDYLPTQPEPRWDWPAEPGERGSSHDSA